MMASWWTAADMLDSLEENSIVSRVIQAVGLFGDILSLEDVMEPMSSEHKRGDKVEISPDSGEVAASDEAGMVKSADAVAMEEDKEEQVETDRDQEVQVPRDKDDNKREEKEKEDEDENLQSVQKRGHIKEGEYDVGCIGMKKQTQAEEEGVITRSVEEDTTEGEKVETAKELDEEEDTRKWDSAMEGNDDGGKDEGVKVDNNFVLKEVGWTAKEETGVEENIEGQDEEEEEKCGDDGVEKKKEEGVEDGEHEREREEGQREEEVWRERSNKDKEEKEEEIGETGKERKEEHWEIKERKEVDVDMEEKMMRKQEQEVEALLELGCCREKKGTLMDAAARLLVVAGHENKELIPTQNPAMEAKDGEGDREGGDEDTLKMKCEVDDKKSCSQRSSKYKTVSYRRIRKGNTKQRIDEFEAIMNL